MNENKYENLFDELRNKNVFCDAILKVEEEEFPVHKIVLCNSSNYFRAMFEHLNDPNTRDFTVNGVSSDIMALVLQWIYTESTTFLSSENVQEVFAAAKRMLLEELVEICFCYLEDNMCPENCIGIWKFSHVVDSEKTKDLARRFIMSHFGEVMNCDEFQHLTAEELSSFLENDELNVTTETVVYQAVLHWTNHDLQQRRADFPQVLTQVRFDQMSPDFLNVHVLSNPLVIALDDVNFLNRPTRLRLPGAILLAMGGRSRHNPANGIAAYDYKADRWVNVTTHQERARAYHGSVFLNGSIYCVGGLHRTECFNSVQRLDLATRRWHEMPPMYHCRCYVSVAVLNDCIYAMGGHNGNMRLDTAEVFDLKTNRWSQIAPMNEQRSDASCAVVNGKIYICGGSNGSEYLQTAECYDPITNQWSLIAPMSTSRSALAVIAYGDHVYAVGGYNRNAKLRSVEAYSPHSDSWRPVASMMTPRSSFGIEVLNGRIFAVGGFNGFTAMYTVEAYDPVLDSWSTVCDMNMRRSGLNCCVIFGLPNMADYAFSRDALDALDTLDDSDEDSS